MERKQEIFVFAQVLVMIVWGILYFWIKPELFQGILGKKNPY